MDEDKAASQARAWVALGKAVGWSADNLAGLAAWLDSDPRNREAWLRAEADWRALAAFRDDLAGPLAAARLARPSWIYRHRILVVTLFLAFALTPWLYHGAIGHTQQWVTATGERRDVVLADGTRLSLNTATRLEVQETWFTRTLRLDQGEVYADVAPDRRSFIVRTPRLQVTDVGTRFTVRDTRDRLEVGVLAGLVDVQSAGGRVRLAAGQQAVGGGPDRMLVMQPLPSGTDAWREGWIVFSDVELSQVTRELSRYHGIDLQVADEAPRGLRVNGRFRIGDVDSALSAISQTLGLSVDRVSPGKIVLRTTDH